MRERVLIKPIVLDTHAAYCLRAREDAFVLSFGNADRFHGADGQGGVRYLAWLKTLCEQDPAGAMHLWLDGDIIGQIELKKLTHYPEIGYVNFYYLEQRMRGTGVSALLEDYAQNYFRALSCRTMQLSVSTSNTRAICFYIKNGWRNIGARPDDPHLILMEKALT